MGQNNKNVNAKLVGGKAERHIFNVVVKLNVIAPITVTAEIIAAKVDKLVDKYLYDTFKVSKIEMPTRPGMPVATGDFIYELKDKMEDIR